MLENCGMQIATVLIIYNLSVFRILEQTDFTDHSNLPTLQMRKLRFTDSNQYGDQPTIQMAMLSERIWESPKQMRMSATQQPVN